jgi:alkyl sulfatase BDS1-like metallo-beta-lactamase superfamily hydrolase
MHNIIMLPGAHVRDTKGWAAYLTESIGLYGGQGDVAFASHHWPMWGGDDEIVVLLEAQRDLYAYVRDQTLRMLNSGLTAGEIAEDFQLPPTLAEVWANWGYYGSIGRNVKGIYQRYMGWFDANPARLWEHPPVAQAKRYVKALGGLDSALSKAREFVVTAISG